MSLFLLLLVVLCIILNIHLSQSFTIIRSITHHRYRRITSSITNLFAKRKSRLITSQRRPQSSITNTSTDENSSDDDSDPGLTILMADKAANTVDTSVATSPVLQQQQVELRSSIAADLTQFRAKRSPTDSSTSPTNLDDLDLNSTSDSETDKSLWKSISDGISILLVADLFVVLIFLAWFLAAVVLQGSQPDILLSFQSNFPTLVLPALTVLMAGSIASGAIGKLQEFVESQQKNNDNRHKDNTNRKKTDW